MADIRRLCWGFVVVDPKLIAGGVGAVILLTSRDTFDESRWTITDTGIENTPSDTELAALRLTAKRMLKIASDGRKLGCMGASLNVTSAYRCARVNSAIGGSPTSEHLTGRACDFYVGNPYVWAATMRLLLQADAYGPIHQVIIYPNSSFAHIGWYEPDDNRTARDFMQYKNGVYSYI